MEVQTKNRKGIKGAVMTHVIEFKKQLPLQVMVWPGIIFMIVFSFIPIYGLSIAFKNYTVVDSLSSAKWVGLENFKIVLRDRYFWLAVKNTLVISFLKLIIGFPLPIILALLIYQIKEGPLKKIVQTISYLPHFISWIILGGMVISWLSTTGFFSQILVSLGIIDASKNILLDSGKYYWIATISDVWKEAGWGTIIYLASMAGIDKTYYEAARIDGAGKLRQIWSITLPLIKAIISLNLMLSVSGLLGSNFDQTLVLLNTQNQKTAEVIDSYVYRMGMTQGDFSYATAVGIGVSIVSVIVLLITNQVTKRLNDQTIL